MPEPISLYVYDLSNGMARQWGRMLTGRDVEGIWHTSLVLYGMEVFYGQGIDIASPGSTHHGQPVKKLTMGTTQIDRDTFMEYIEGMKQVYSADKYHLLDFNCNTFTNDVLGFLNGNQIPQDIRNLPSEIMSTPFGRNMRPMIDQMFRGGNNRRPDASNAVQSLLGPAANPTDSSLRADNPSSQSLSSNLQICTSSASMRTTISESLAVAVMYTSANCPPCNAIKPYFEELAGTHGRAPKRIVFVIVEMGVGAGATVAQDVEFGGPIRSTPTFVFFARGKKVGDCLGADRQELKTQVQLLEMEAYPQHVHTKLSLPSLTTLSKTLRPIVYLSFPPLAALAKKLDSEKLDSTTRETFSKQVIPYLTALPEPPTAPITPAPIETWIAATERALSVLPEKEWFPFIDAFRLALARDSTRLSTSQAFVNFLPRLLQKATSNVDAADKALTLTLVRLASNLLPSPTFIKLVLDLQSVLQQVTAIIIRALLDPEQSIRSAGAGLAWSVIGRVWDRRVNLAEAIDEQVGEEWQVEMASALVEALSKEQTSVEVVHRLSATLGLLIYQSKYDGAIRELVEVLNLATILKEKEVLAKGNESLEKLLKELALLCQ